MTRHVTAEEEPRDRFSIYRLCDCPTCEGRGKVLQDWRPSSRVALKRCSDCRGEGKIRDEIASCDSPEAVGVALVTLAREGEFEECPVGLLDRQGEIGHKWLIRPWMPSARNVHDAAVTLAKSKRKARSS